jgi:mRNA interferase YafQ
MKRIEFLGRFSKDLKLMVKRGKPVAKLQSVMAILARGHPLEAKYKAHKLVGNFSGYLVAIWNAI